MSITDDGVFEISGIGGNPFSASGDSGSLVFFKQRSENKLYPLGLHYASQNNLSYVIPLWRILSTFCEKNHLNSVLFSVTNPRIPGECFLGAIHVSAMED